MISGTARRPHIPRFIFSRVWQVQSGTPGIPGRRHSSVGTVTVLRVRRTRSRIRIVGGSKVIFLRRTKSTATVGFTLRCGEREAEDFSPGMYLTGYAWQLTVAFCQGRSVSTVRLLVWCFLEEESLFILLVTKSCSYSVISAIVFCFTDI